jgi:hypothetical protein
LIQVVDKLVREYFPVVETGFLVDLTVGKSEEITLSLVA